MSLFTGLIGLAYLFQSIDIFINYFIIVAAEIGEFIFGKTGHILYAAEIISSGPYSLSGLEESRCLIIDHGERIAAYAFTLFHLYVVSPSQNPGNR